ncbi:MAG: hypothetical protein JKX99_08070, partial [Robiginitomaculum sp.]|nr:hypothetical protein [Robiginitomaculum sp.]
MFDARSFNWLSRTVKQILVFVGLGLLLPVAAQADTLAEQIAAAAVQRTQHQITYDGRYLALDYPGG